MMHLGASDTRFQSACSPFRGTQRSPSFAPCADVLEESCRMCAYACRGSYRLSASQCEMASPSRLLGVHEGRSRYIQPHACRVRRP